MSPQTITIVITLGLIILTIIAIQTNQFKVARQEISFIQQPTVTSIPQVTISPTAQPLPTSASNDLVYPGAKQLNLDTYESTDNPETITNWYKNKIKDLGFKTTSSVETNTNGDILNKLASNNNSKEIRIEISKDNNQSVTRINIH